MDPLNPDTKFVSLADKAMLFALYGVGIAAATFAIYAIARLAG